MIIAYDSNTGNVERFIRSLDMDCIKISDGLILDEDFILVTYTTGFGEVPNRTKKFLANNHSHMKGVASSGNINWGRNYGKSGHIIAFHYNVPILLIFELSGTPNDIDKFKKEVDRIVEQNS